MKNDADYTVDHVEAAMSYKCTNVTFGSYKISNNYIYARSTQDPGLCSNGSNARPHNIYDDGGPGSTSGGRLTNKDNQ